MASDGAIILRAARVWDKEKRGEKLKTVPLIRRKIYESCHTNEKEQQHGTKSGGKHLERGRAKKVVRSITVAM